MAVSTRPIKRSSAGGIWRIAVVSALIFAVPLPTTWAAPAALMGDYESARTSDEEFVRLSLQAGGKAVIVAENNFMIPGDASKRRGRTTSYGKWSRKGEIVTVTYSKVRDRLKFDTATPLARIGMTGTAVALAPAGKVDARSRLKNLTLWRLPHKYRLPEASAGPAAAVPPAK